jgi:co-chaperonin GroES (HSP10)
MKDTLASGGKTAQFSTAANMTDFEADVLYKDVPEVLAKYGLSQAEYDTYSAMRLNNEKLPDLLPVDFQEGLKVEFSVTDHRKNYMNVETTDVKSAEVESKKFPEPTYGSFRPILDRILVMRVSDDPDMELLEDGSTRSRKSGLVTASKYRQHSNVGIVLAAGQWVVLGGVKFPMADFVRPKDKVCFGEYNAENFAMEKTKVEALCDSLGVNYVDDKQGLRLVRLQDVRGIEAPNV